MANKVIDDNTRIHDYGEGGYAEIVDADGSMVYLDGKTVKLCSSTLCVKAYNEGGYAYTIVDLRDIFDWIQQNKPEWIHRDVVYIEWSGGKRHEEMPDGFEAFIPMTSG